MRQLHFDCFSGISGDMVLGALVDTGLPFGDLARALKDARIPGYALKAKTVKRDGLHATKVDVAIRTGFEAPLSLQEIRRAIRASGLPTPVKERSLETFDRLAKAEGLAHRVKASGVRFHEVGVVDSLVDVIGSILGCHLLDVQHITASPVNLGAGMVTTSHGPLPVPGPAVAKLARGVPVYSDGPRLELTTPTGMALLKTLAQEFTALPALRISRVGYGAGTSNPDGWPNVLRLFLGDTDGGPKSGIGETDTVTQIETNLDDLTPQAYETVMDRLFGAGAVDVSLTPIIMKHGRPGIMLTALAPPEKAERVADLMLQETTTLGVRITPVTRRILPRRMDQVTVRGETVHMKVADLGQGRRKAAPEYQDCKRVAEQTGRPVRDILEEAASAWRSREGRSRNDRTSGHRARRS